MRGSVARPRPVSHIHMKNNQPVAAVTEWSWPRNRGRQVLSSSFGVGEYPPCRGADAREICRGPISSYWRSMEV
ncbi:hypothetical protein TNCV_4427131 [Trichonephila clavipes]|nr:hypothetical protein TNCV_4427131 [Trichonephila clavipes]